MYARTRTLALTIIGLAAAAPLAAQQRPMRLAAVEVEMTGETTTIPTSPLQGVRQKSPGASMLLSLLITGGGQFYNEQPVKGAIMLVLAGVGTAMMIDGIDEYDCYYANECMPWLLPVGAGVAGVTKIWSIIDAGAGANAYNRRHAGGTLKGAVVPLRGGGVGIQVASVAF